MSGAISFETWRRILQIGCIAKDKVEVFDALGDTALRILYENGVDPTVGAVIKNDLNAQLKK